MTANSKNSGQYQGSKFPPEALSDMRVAGISGQSVYFRKLEPAHPESCQNCGGEGYLWFQYSKSGPLDQPAVKGPSTFHNGKWYAVESKMYPCPACGGSRQNQVEFLFENSGLEIDERDWTLKYFSKMVGKEDAVREARKMLAALPKPSGWLVLHGTYGMGKSGVMRAVVAACCQHLVQARYVRAEDFLRELRATFGDDAEVSEDAMMQRYGRYQVLAIDEVDRVSDTKWSRSALFTLLDTRYKRRNILGTLLATNCDPIQMPAGFEYLQSRMKHGERVEMVGKDLRG